MPTARKRTAEGFLTLGLLGTFFWVVRVLFEIVGDAETAETIAKHSASISHLFASGLEATIGFFFSPVGSSITVFLAGGYLWIDNRRHKRNTAVSQSRETEVAQLEQTPVVRIASPIPELTAVVTSAESPPRVVHAEERIIVDLTPGELVAPFETQVQIQAERTVARYIGKWYRVSGSVNQIHRYSDCWTVRFFAPDPAHFVGVQIALEFALALTERIDLLDRGSAIVAIGQIALIGSSSITLKRCEFVA
jgi:hypothetical protein